MLVALMTLSERVRITDIVIWPSEIFSRERGSFGPMVGQQVATSHFKALSNSQNAEEFAPLQTDV